MPLLDTLDLDTDDRLRRAIYTAGIIFFLIPYGVGLAAVWPLQFGSVQWRFTAAGALAGELTGPFLGQMIILLVARATDNRGMARAMGIIAAITSVFLVLVIGLFALDSLQIRTIVKTAEMSRFNKTIIPAAVAMFLYAFGFGMLAAAALRNPKGSAKIVTKNTKRTAPDQSLGLLIGQDYTDK